MIRRAPALLLLVLSCRSASPDDPLLDEHLFGAEELRRSGSFQRSSHAQAPTCLLSTVDTIAEKASENFVEVSFTAEAGRKYRAYAYVGSCCAEVGQFSVQGSDLVVADPHDKTVTTVVDPGGRYAVPVQAVGRGENTLHERHGGEKAPVWWEWVALPMPPEYKSGGLKRIRILTEHRGFAVGCVLLTNRKMPKMPLFWIAAQAQVFRPMPPAPEEEALLQEADRLWTADADAAIRIYRRLLSEFGGSPAVKGARTRIQKRAEQGD